MKNIVSLIDSGEYEEKYKELDEETIVSYVFQKLLQMNNLFKLANKYGKQEEVLNCFDKMITPILRGEPVKDKKIKNYLDRVLERVWISPEEGSKYISLSSIKTYMSQFGKISDDLLIACNNDKDIYNDFVDYLCTRLLIPGWVRSGSLPSNKLQADCRKDLHYWYELSEINISVLSSENIFTILNKLAIAARDVFYGITLIAKGISNEGTSLWEDIIKDVYSKWCVVTKNGLTCLYWRKEYVLLSEFLSELDGIVAFSWNNCFKFIMKCVTGAIWHLYTNYVLLEDMGVWDFKGLKLGFDVNGTAGVIMGFPGLMKFIVSKSELSGEVIKRSDCFVTLIRDYIPELISLIKQGSGDANITFKVCMITEVFEWLNDRLLVPDYFVCEDKRVSKRYYDALFMYLAHYKKFWVGTFFDRLLAYFHPYENFFLKGLVKYDESLVSLIPERYSKVLALGNGISTPKNDSKTPKMICVLPDSEVSLYFSLCKMLSLILRGLSIKGETAVISENNGVYNLECSGYKFSYGGGILKTNIASVRAEVIEKVKKRFEMFVNMIKRMRTYAIDSITFDVVSSKESKGEGWVGRRFRHEEDAEDIWNVEIWKLR